MTTARMGRVVAVIFALVLQGTATAQQHQQPAKPSLALQAAREAGEWLLSVARKTDGGITWPVVPDDSPDAQLSLYSGTPGVILFMLELHRATGEQRWLDAAINGGDDLIASVASEPADAALIDAGLWTGLGGQMFVLHRLHRATGEARFLEAARYCAKTIMNAARPLDDIEGTACWSDSTDIISGTAGIGLALLYAHDHLEVDGALETATHAGVALLHQAIEVELDEGETGLKWAMSTDFPRLMPNFSHGTAGNAYFLIELHRRGPVRDTRFLKAAKRGAKYLLSIADTNDNRCLIFHHEPAGEDLYYLSWCHGPVGTARLFHALAAATDDADWAQWVDRGVNGIVSMGAPHRKSAGFWNNVGQCCGSAGIGSFALDLLRRENQSEETARRCRRLAQVCMADVIAHADRIALPGQKTGLKWSQAEHRLRPEFLQAQTGYMQGAAGIGLFLLDMYFAEVGRDPVVRFPDEPAW